MGYFSSLEEAARRDHAKVYIQCMQAIGSYWKGYLRPSDCNVLQFVIDRTLRWGKVCEIITYNQMLRGVYSSDGTCICSRVNLPRRTLFRVVSRLEQNGFFSISRIKSTRSGYESNIFEINCKLILSRDAMALPSNKKTKNLPLCQNAPTLVPKRHHPLCQNDTTNIHKGELTESNSQKNQPPAGGSRFGAIEDAVGTIRARSSALRAQKIARVNSSFRYQSIVALWQETVLRYYPRVPVVGMTAKQFAMFKKLITAQLKNVDVVAFFEWVVSHWVELRGGPLAWMNRKTELVPLTPSLDVLSRYLRVFIKVYAESVTLDQVSEEKSQRRALSSVEAELIKTRQALADQIAENRRIRTEKGRETKFDAEYAPLPTRRRVSVGGGALERAKRIYEEE